LDQPLLLAFRAQKQLRWHVQRSAVTVVQLLLDYSYSNLDNW
jgi:hypothetical protein